MSDGMFTSEQKAAARAQSRELSDAVARQLREFLFDPAEPRALAARVAESMAPFFDALRTKHERQVKDYIKIDEDKPFDAAQGVLNLNIDMRLFEGWSAGVLREMNHPVADEVPDCATLQVRDNGEIYFDWVELDFTIEKDGSISASRKEPEADASDNNDTSRRALEG